MKIILSALLGFLASQTSFVQASDYQTAVTSDPGSVRQALLDLGVSSAASQPQAQLNLNMDANGNLTQTFAVVFPISVGGSAIDATNVTLYTDGQKSYLVMTYPSASDANSQTTKTSIFPADTGSAQVLANFVKANSSPVPVPSQPNMTLKAFGYSLSEIDCYVGFAPGGGVTTCDIKK